MKLEDIKLLNEYQVEDISPSLVQMAREMGGPIPPDVDEGYIKMTFGMDRDPRGADHVVHKLAIRYGVTDATIVRVLLSNKSM